MIHDGAGPSGTGTEPTGWMLGSANAGVLDANSVIQAATAAASLPMADEPIRCRRGASPVLNLCMRSLAEISDRLDIQQLLVDYATAIDHRRFDDLDRIFTPDAYIDYRAMGGIDGDFPTVKAWLAEVLPNFPAYCHLIGNFDITLHGDTATARTMCLNPMQLSGSGDQGPRGQERSDSGDQGPRGQERSDSGDQGGQVLFCALWYDDELVRTADGWRLTRRVEAKCLTKLV